MDARSASFDAVVVGRGAVGAAAALGLSQAGLKVGWIGPAARPAPESEGWDARVFALSPGTRELLRGLRVWDAMPAARIAPVYDMRVYAGPGAEAPELHLDAYSGRVDALSWIVENRTLTRTLDDALRFAGVASVDDAVSALQLDEGPQGGAVLTLASGRTIAAKLVVAADGADSTLRGLAGIEPRVRDYGQRGVVANFDTTLPHGDTAYQWFGPELGVLALLPLPSGSPERGRASMVWSAPEALAAELLALSPEALVWCSSHEPRGDVAAFDAAWPRASTFKGFSTTIAHNVRPSEEVWLWLDRAASDVEEVRARLVSREDPARVVRAARLPLRGLVVVALLGVSSATVLALWPPIFGLVSTLGGAAGLGFFLAIQPLGTAARDKALLPDRRRVGGLWQRDR